MALILGLLMALLYIPGLIIILLMDNVARMDNGCLYLMVLSLILAYIVSISNIKNIYKYIMYIWLIFLVAIERILNRINIIHRLNKNKSGKNVYAESLPYMINLWIIVLGLTGLLYFKGDYLMDMLSNTSMAILN